MNKSKIIRYIVISLYILVNVFIIFNHEAWRDEAQAYLIAKNLNITEIFKILRIEGHPILWFLIIKLFTILNISFYYFSFLSLALMTVALFVFLKKSPFSFTTNVLVILSTIFNYYNPVICRNYSLIVLLTTLVFCYYNEKFDKPVLYLVLVSLLMQTHIKVFGLCFGLCMDFLIQTQRRDKKKSKLLFIPLLSFVMLFFELIPDGKHKPYKEINSTILNNFFNKLFHGVSRIVGSSFGVSNKWINLSVIIVFVIMVCVLVKETIQQNMVKKYLPVIAFAIFSFGYYYFFDAYIYRSHTQMSSILSVTVLAFVWIMTTYENSRITKCSIAILALYCIFSIPMCIKGSYLDIISNYSNSKMTSNYIEKNIEEGSIILLKYDCLNPAVCSYVQSERNDIIFYDASHKKEYTFHQWGEEIDDPDLIDILYEISKENKSSNIYLLTSERIYNEEFIEIYQNIDIDSVTAEKYALYKYVE